MISLVPRAMERGLAIFLCRVAYIFNIPTRAHAHPHGSSYPETLMHFLCDLHLDQCSKSAFLISCVIYT